LKVHRSRSVRHAKVVPDGKNLVSHAGAALLAELAGRGGLTVAMSVAMEDCGISWHPQDPGVVLTHLGGRCLSRDHAPIRSIPRHAMAIGVRPTDSMVSRTI
jgi:hypothetical protein